MIRRLHHQLRSLISACLVLGQCLVLSNSLSAQATSITTFPTNYVYVFEESRKDSIFSVIIHNLAVVHRQEPTVELEKLVIDFYRNGIPFQQSIILSEDIVKSNRQLYQLQQSNMLAAYDFMFHTKDLLGKSGLTNSALLKKDSGIIMRKLFFTMGHSPDSIRISAFSKGRDGQNPAIATLYTRYISSSNRFILPVAGSWYAAAGPSAHTHHRWGYMEEFAYDFVQMGEGNLTYKGDHRKAANYHCYGKEVLAIADGEVAAVLDGIDDAEIYPKDLPQIEYMKLVQAKQNELATKYGMEGLSGNAVVLKLGNNEFAFYGHLQKGSITIKPGDKVIQGQLIGKIGNSGNSTEPHLHFQLNEGKDALNSRSIPIRFKNLNWSESFEPEGSYIKSGDWVRTK